MAPRPDWMVDVELVDEDTGAARPPRAAAGGDGADIPPPEPTAVGPNRRRPSRWLAAAGLLLVALGVAVGVVLATGGGHRGPLLDEPLTAAWSVPGGMLLGGADGVVVVRSGGVVTAYAETDGEILWALRLGAPAAVDVCAPTITTDPATLWCWRNKQTVRSSGGAQQREAAVVGLALRDGSVVAEHAMTVPWAGLVAVGDGLVTGERVHGDLTVQRLDTRSWRPRWQTQLSLEADPVTGMFGTSVEALGDLVVVQGPTAAVLDADDGRTIRTWGRPSDDDPLPAGERVVVTVAPHGFAAQAVRAADDTPTGRGVWYDNAGRQVVRFEGILAEPSASDGSEPGVLLVSRERGSEVAAIDAATGKDLWTMATDDAAVLARSDGIVVIATGGEVTGVELLTGWRPWTTPVSGLRSDAGTVSDGSVALVMAVQRRVWTFVALDVASGELRWTAPAAGAPDLDDLFVIGGAPRLEVVDDRLVVRSGQGMTWLR